MRLKTDCVPGRKGCVLVGKAEFAVPAEERVRLLEEAKRRAALAGETAGEAAGAEKSS